MDKRGPRKNTPAELRTDWNTDRAGIAHVLNVSINHINKLVRRGLPREGRGLYSIPACVQWALQDAINQAGLDPDELPAVVEAREQLYRAQTRHKTLESHRLAGDLIELDFAKAGVAEVASECVQGVEQLPGRAAAECAAAATEPEAREVLTRHGSEIRQRICDRLEAVARGIGDRAGDPETGAEA